MPHGEIADSTSLGVREYRVVWEGVGNVRGDGEPDEGAGALALVNEAI